MFIRGELIETCSVDTLLITVNSEICLKYTLKHTVSKFLRARIDCSPPQFFRKIVESERLPSVGYLAFKCTERVSADVFSGGGRETRRL